jgi:hypothetical protein
MNRRLAEDDCSARFATIIDYLSFLCGAVPVEVQTHDFANPGSTREITCCSRYDSRTDPMERSLILRMRPMYSKERVKCFGGGSVAVLEDFRYLETVRHGRKTVSSRSR